MDNFEIKMPIEINWQNYSYYVIVVMLLQSETLYHILLLTVSGLLKTYNNVYQILFSPTLYIALSLHYI